MLVREFGLDPEYVDGTHKVYCSLTGAPCTVCAGPKEFRSCSYALLTMVGLTPAEAMYLYVLHSEEVWRQAALQCFYQTGELPGKGKAKISKKAVEKRISDPLHDFPDDVEYFDSEGVHQQIELSKLHDSFNKDRPEHMKWNQFRAEACRGKHGKAARRCSMNDVLWGRFLEYKRNNVEMPLEMVEKFLRADMLLRQIYKEPDTPASIRAFEELRDL